jgi:NADH-quinone oxidoreductase subunit J
VFDIIFWLLAFTAVVAALGVVALRDVFRAALSMILLFLAVAGIYVTLYADFLAVVQVLIYVGAISILIVVAVMLTQDVWRGSPSGRFRLPAFVAALAFVLVLGWGLVGTKWLISSEGPKQPTVTGIGASLFGEGGYLLPVEIAGFLLVAAIIGAIALMREK